MTPRTRFIGAIGSVIWTVALPETTAAVFGGDFARQQRSA